MARSMRETVAMAIDPRAGKPADPSMLVDVDRLIAAYYDAKPDPRSRNSAWHSGRAGIVGRH